jgi:riboflavin synthase
VRQTARRADAWLIDLALPEELQSLMVPLGSVAVDGVSLTVNALQDPEGIQLSIIEFTERHTTLGALQAGDQVHVEADMVAKHIARLTTPHRAALAGRP